MKSGKSPDEREESLWLKSFEETDKAEQLEFDEMNDKRFEQIRKRQLSNIIFDS